MVDRVFSFDPPHVFLSKARKTLQIIPSRVPKQSPYCEGKFFQVWLREGTCYKWLKTTQSKKPYGGIAEIAAIHLILYSEFLSPPIFSVLYDPVTRNVGIHTKDVPIIDKPNPKSLKFQRFLRRFVEATENWKLNRISYDELPGVDSFMLETKGRRNLGLYGNHIVLVDIDPKCWSDDARVEQIRNFIVQALKQL